MWKFKFLCSENVSLTISSLFGRGGMRLVCSALLASALVVPVAHAQETNDDENELEEIVVTATRIPTPLADTLPTTAIITAEDIERIKPQDFGELLKLTSGIGFRDSGGRGSSGGLFVRGTSPKHTLILIDGIRTSSATSGDTAIQGIPLESIERIETIKGPMSGVYGADAIGGVIQIFTKAYQEEGAFGKVSTTAGSYQLRKHYARAGYGDENFGVSVSLSKESTDGIDRTQFKGGGNEDKDSFKQDSESFSLSVYPQDNLVAEISHIQSSATIEYDNTNSGTTKLQISRKDEESDTEYQQRLEKHLADLRGYEEACPVVPYIALHEQRELRAPSTTSATCIGRGWHQRTKLNTTSVQLNYDHAENVKFSGKFGVTKDFLTDKTPGNTDTNNSYFNTKKTDYSIQANYILSTQNQVSVGLDYQSDKVGSKRKYAENARNNKGIFALWQYNADRTSTVVNARYDKSNRYGSASNYSIQQSLDLSDKYQIVGSYGTAFRAPTLNDLYYPKSTFFGVTYGGNPNLKPEKSKSFELSLRAPSDDFFWQINSYHTKVDNLISWSEGPIPVNIHEATIKGVEFELSREWDDYIFRTSLDYLDAKDDKTGKFLPDRARASGSIELGKQIDNFYVGVDTFFEHARFEKFSSSDPGKFLPGYALWGMSANYNYQDRLLISGRIDNLFDKQYVTNLATEDNAYQNEGRTVQISVEYKF